MADREKLIELIDEALESGCRHNSCSYCSYLGVKRCSVSVIADHLIANGVTVQKWIPVTESPEEYRDESGELIPFLVCEKSTEYPFRGLYDGKTWGDGLISVYPTHWMPLPEPPKEEHHD